MTCEKCGIELRENYACHGVSRGYIEDDGFYPDEGPWIVLCEDCWDDSVKLIWPWPPPQTDEAPVGGD